MDAAEPSAEPASRHHVGGIDINVFKEEHDDQKLESCKWILSGQCPQEAVVFLLIFGNLNDMSKRCLEQGTRRYEAQESAKAASGNARSYALWDAFDAKFELQFMETMAEITFEELMCEVVPKPWDEDL